MAPEPPIIEVILTGFEPFRGPVNPSWEIAKRLDGQRWHIPASPPLARRVENSRNRPAPTIIRIHSELLPVEYAPVARLIPDLHADKKSGSKDGEDEAPIRRLYVHLGQVGDHPVHIERQAFRGPYNIPDNKGKVPDDPYIRAYDDVSFPKDYGIVSNRAVVREERTQRRNALPTEVDVDGLCGHLRDKGWAHVCESSDPGMYLCGYSYYISLGEAAGRNAERSPDGQGVSEHVLFVHFPPLDAFYTLEECMQLTKDIITWLAEHTL